MAETAEERSASVLAPKVVVADDDELALTLLTDGLNGLGLQIKPCLNAKDAILLSLKITPDAVMLDVKMPGLDTLKAIKMIRLMEPLRPVPVILMVDSLDKNVVLQAIQQGASDCVSKASSLHDISLRVHRVLKTPRPSPPPAYDALKYFFHFDGGALTLDIDSEITTDSGKNLVELVRNLTGLMPLKLVLNLEKVPSIAASGIGYLSDVKDTVVNCGGTIALSQVDLSRYAANVTRFLEKYLQIESPAVKS